MKSIYEYCDYREYLVDYYKYRKAGDNDFSYRAMAREMDFSSPNYLKLVMDGKRNVGSDSLDRITVGLGLRRREAEYFSLLVLFSQSKDNAKKSQYYGDLLSLREKSSIAKISPSQYEYYSSWHNCVVRELAAGLPSETDPADIGRKAHPAISARDVKKSIEMLVKLGMLLIDEKGCYKHSSPVINTDNEVKSVAVRRYHKEMIGIAADALDNVEPSRREITSVTVRISEDGFVRMKQRIGEFREELLRIACDDRDVDRVYQLNFQFFPVSQI